MLILRETLVFATFGPCVYLITTDVFSVFVHDLMLTDVLELTFLY